MISTRNTQKGFSLLELLLVVAVGAILILAGLAIYRNITQNTDVNEASRLISVLKQETQRIFQGEPTYADVTNTILTNAQVVPAKYTTGAGVIVSPFRNSAVVVEPNANDENFDITLEDVPSEACLKLGLEYNNNDSDFINVSIDGNDIPTPSVATVDNACGDGVDMIWTFN